MWRSAAKYRGYVDGGDTYFPPHLRSPEEWHLTWKFSLHVATFTSVPQITSFWPKDCSLATISSAAGCTGKATGAGSRGTAHLARPTAPRAAPHSPRPSAGPPAALSAPSPSRASAAQACRARRSSGCPPPASWGCHRSAASSRPGPGGPLGSASTGVSAARTPAGRPLPPPGPPRPLRPPMPERAAHLRAARGAGCGARRRATRAAAAALPTTAGPGLWGNGHGGVGEGSAGAERGWHGTARPASPKTPRGTAARGHSRGWAGAARREPRRLGVDTGDDMAGCATGTQARGDAPWRPPAPFPSLRPPAPRPSPQHRRPR